jgi:hypothetical protein
VRALREELLCVRREHALAQQQEACLRKELSALRRQVGVGRWEDFRMNRKHVQGA